MTPTDDPRRLLLLQPSRASVGRALAAGFRVWSVRDPASDDGRRLDEAEGHAQQVVWTDTSDAAGLASLVRDTARRHHLGRGLHLGGRRGRFTALAALDASGLSLTSAQSVHRITDRAAMRRLLNENGRFTVRAREAHSVADVRELAGRWGRPVVVKHVGAAGPDDVTPVTGPADLAAWAARREADAAPGPYLVEEFLPGPAYGVYTLTVDGAHHVLAITARQHDGGTVTEVYPAPLGIRERAELRAATTALLDLAGYRFGAAHTRLVLTARGAGVVAAEDCFGGRGPDLLRIAAGYDPELWLFRALARERVPCPVPYRAAAAADLAPPPTGGQAGLDEIASLRYVRRLSPPRPDTGRPGRVAVEAASPAEASERIAIVCELWGGAR
ncbi:ATP-grasp domain-containing protein [Streptomyces sp. NPDC003710]